MSGLLDPQGELVGGLGRVREITLIMELEVVEGRGKTLRRHKQGKE